MLNVNGSNSCCNFAMFRYLNLVYSSELLKHHFITSISSSICILHNTPLWLVLPLLSSPCRPENEAHFPHVPETRPSVPKYPHSGVILQFW